MMTSSVHLLLERAIDTPVKLQCVVSFAQRTLSRGTTAHIAARISRDIWSTKQALEELTEAGILSTVPNDGEPIYEYAPKGYLKDALALLIDDYNDPLRRVEVHDYVRELALYAPYRADFGQLVAM
ncbi:MAG: hypothetical protein H0T53_15640 [Herpetosiphonaceae bacterium]|nr:hypothetical protein [Herpetosiphonaceae bacterium]